MRRHRLCGDAASFMREPAYLAGAGAGAAGAPVDAGAEPVVAGAGADGVVAAGPVPVVVTGEPLLAVCGPVPAVPAHHQTPRPISTTTMMPMIQLPEPPPAGGRRGGFGL